jgi:hypothetical protein
MDCKEGYCDTAINSLARDNVGVFQIDYFLFHGKSTNGVAQAIGGQGLLGNV